MPPRPLTTSSATMFVDGLAGIPGLIVNQIQGAFTPNHQDPARAPTYIPEDRIIRLILAGPHDVKVTVWWTTSVVPPNPSVDSLVLLDDRLAGGNYPIPIPEYIPAKSAFATVQVDASTPLAARREVSSTTSIASDSESAISACCAGSSRLSVMIGSGSHSP